MNVVLPIWRGARCRISHAKLPAPVHQQPLKSNSKHDNVVEMFNPEFLATENNDPNDEYDLIQYLQKYLSIELRQI